MKSIYFEQTTEVRSVKMLQAATGISEFYFDPGTIVIFKGSISLAGGIHFRGRCKIDDGVSIDTGCVLKDVSIGEGTQVRSHSILNNCSLGKNNIIGPYCFVRDGTLVGDSCIVGSHVEVTRSELAAEVKISHQAFIGDAIIENCVIIGAGVVFCNFDGFSKQLSKIGEGTIVGSGTLIVSPIKVGARVVIGAGSVVTKDIEDDERLVQRRSC